LNELHIFGFFEKNNRGSRCRGMRIERNREPEFLSNRRFMLENGSSTDPIQYVFRDEFLREIGKIEGKFDAFNQVWRQQITDLITFLQFHPFLLRTHL